MLASAQFFSCPRFHDFTGGPGPPHGLNLSCEQHEDAAAQADQFAWDRLAELTDTYGQRISGSENLVRAIAWAQEAMQKDGLENVHTERVMVPRWVRGNESLEIVNPPHHVVPMLGLGGSVATPPAGVEAEVIVVSNGEELTRRASTPRQDRASSTFSYTNYGERPAYRSAAHRDGGARRSLASLVRSVGRSACARRAHRLQNYLATSRKFRRRVPPRMRMLSVSLIARKGSPASNGIAIDDAIPFTSSAEIRGSESRKDRAGRGHFDSGSCTAHQPMRRSSLRGNRAPD